MWMNAVSGVLLAAVSLFWDRNRLKRAGGRAKLVYALLFAYALYTGSGYILDMQLPNLHSLTRMLFHTQAAQIDKLLKADTYG